MRYSVDEYFQSLLAASLPTPPFRRALARVRGSILGIGRAVIGLAWRPPLRRAQVLRSLALSGACWIAFTGSTLVHGSDHLDSPAAVANPAGDITDIYAWTAPDGRHLNLVMTIQGHAFSDKIQYVLHIDSGGALGRTTASIPLTCRFASATTADCRLGDIDTVAGDPAVPGGIESRHHSFRMYAGRRDDPFYNNIKGLLGAYQAASSAIHSGAAVDAGGCAHFDPSATKTISEQMRHTDGGPAVNFLSNWTVSAIVVSVDLATITKGGPLLAIWGTTSVGAKRLDRMARPFVGNTLLGAAPFSTDDASGVLRERYNGADPATSAEFVPDLEKGLAFQDSLDGVCGNQLLAGQDAGPSRYHALATLFADDRLWVNSASTVCRQFFAVELATVPGHPAAGRDCGGRTPTYDTSNVWRSLLIAGTTTGISDGLQEDEHPASATTFPFLAPPDPQAVDH